MNKASILKYFCEMNVDMLDLILDEQLTYQDVYKAQFLEKLEKVFLRFKEDGDIYLQMYPGKCNAVLCNNGCTGYLFVGNKTSNTIAFIFEEKNNCLQDIYCCSSFETKEMGLVLANSHNIRFAQDEKANFKPTIEYSIQLQQSEIACSAIIGGEITPLYTEEYLAWLQQYEPLYKSINADVSRFFYIKFDRFNKLFLQLDQLKQIIDLRTESVTAMEAYALVNLDDKEALVAWLLKYETIFENLSGLVYNIFGNNEPQKGFIQLIQLPNIYIEAETVNFAIQDCEIYFRHFWQEFKNYTDTSFYDEEPWPEIDYTGEDFKNRYSLKYQVEKDKSNDL